MRKNHNVSFLFVGIIILIFSSINGMEVKIQGNEFLFTFSEEECERLAESKSYAWEKAGEICKVLEDSKKIKHLIGDGIIINLLFYTAARKQISDDIHKKSKELIKDYNKPIRWTYSFTPTWVAKQILGWFFDY